MKRQKQRTDRKPLFPDPADTKGKNPQKKKKAKSSYKPWSQRTMADLTPEEKRQRAEWSARVEREFAEEDAKEDAAFAKRLAALKPEQQERLKKIKVDVNKLWKELDADEDEVRRITYGQVKKVKEIGDRLLEAKQIYGRGYTKWERAAFPHIGTSTARLYRQIAHQKNWKKIAPEIYQWKGMTIEEARDLIRVREPGPKPPKDLDAAELKRKFAEMIKWWPKPVKKRLAREFGFMGALDSAAKKFYKEVKREDRLRAEAKARKRTKKIAERRTVSRHPEDDDVTEELLSQNICRGSAAKQYADEPPDLKELI